MYAVIKTGGKQYRVQAGDLLVVEKLAGEPGDAVSFGDVLMIGEGEAVSVGAPLIVGASVTATLIETRKGPKIKVFKKIRRQGYRRTRGHRQIESVLRVTAIKGDDINEAFEGAIDLTPLAVRNARARNLARGMESAAARTEARTEARSAKAAAKAAKPVRAKTAKPKAKPAEKAEAPKAAAGKTAAPAKAATKKPAPAKETAAAKKPAAKAAAKKPKAKS